ncbi:MAG: S9 family peptidase [Ilumatobacter sp.]|nr:S9 family peptidase [Ilumatobacter sp.]
MPTDATVAQQAAPHSTTAAWLAIPAVLHVDPSPDGRRIAVTTTQIPLGTHDELSNIQIVTVANGSSHPLDAAWPGDHTATWSPDGTRLAFVTARTGRPQLAVCDTTSSEPIAISNLPGGVTGPASWSPDGTTLVVAGPRGRLVDRTQPWRVTRPVQWGDGVGGLDDPPQLWVWDPTHGTSEMITDDEWRWSLPRWAPDGCRIAARASFDPDGNRRGQHLRLVQPDGGWGAPAVPGGFAVVHAWAADGSLLVLSIQPEGCPGGSEAQLHLLRTDGTTDRLDGDAPAPLGGTVYGDSPAAVGDMFEFALLVAGTEAYVRTQRGGRMGVAHYSLPTGNWRVVVDGDRCATPLAAGADTLVIADQCATQWCALARVPLDGGGRPAAIGLPGPQEPPTAEVHRFAVASPHDGAPLDAWHLRPAGVDGPLPTVLLVHGGPNAAFGECFLLDAQALCAAGFGVLYTNPHGSTGYGDAFTHSAIDQWGDVPSADVVAVVDDAVARGWADPARLGVAGNSYGGYLSAWLITSTDRFAAAVIENPVTDLLSMYGTSDIGVTFLPMQMGASPLENIEPYLRWSPLLRADRCHTPVLFVSGADDRRCPPSQAFEMHRVLRSLGRTSEVLVLPGSSHEGTTYGPPAARLAHDLALVDWMHRWLRQPGDG